MKIAVVGGGSTYTPELVDGIARLRHLFAVDELVLTDPAEERLALVAGVSRGFSPGTGIPERSPTRLIVTGRWRMPRSFCSR